MKLIAEASHEKPSQILASVVPQLPDAARALLPDNESCKRSLRLIRSKNRPPDPTTLADLFITGDWTLTCGTEKVPFFKFDNGSQATERVIIFATDENLRRLATSDTWFMDGTFDVSPHLFAQVYVIHGEIGFTYYPLVYALLQKQCINEDII